MGGYALTRKRKGNQKSSVTATKIGLGWYSRAAWHRLLEISEDRDQLDDTYEEWEASARRALQQIKNSGGQVEKVPIDPERLLRWCNEKGVAVNGASRAEYVTRMLRQKSG